MERTQENDSPSTIARRKIYAIMAKEKSKGAINAQFAKEDSHFIEACGKAETPVTVRQASKFRNKQGIAYQMRNK